MKDITEVNIQKQLLVENPHDRAGYMKIKAGTPARLGLGRAGTRYKTEALLRFRADHAAAQDAVNSYVSGELIKEMGFITTETKCKDKEEYIERIDLGRQLDDASCEKVKEKIAKNQKVLMLVGDGLSATAVEVNIKELLSHINKNLAKFGLSFDDEQVIFIRHARVRSMNKIGDITGAAVVCLLIGERPGLTTVESLSAYIAYRPTVGMPEARMSVIANIHKGGTSLELGGYQIAKLIATIFNRKKSGIELKDDEASVHATSAVG